MEAGAAAEGMVAIRTSTIIASTDHINEVVIGAGTGVVEEGITTTTTEDLEVWPAPIQFRSISYFSSQTTGVTTDTTTATATAGIAVMVICLVAKSALSIAAILQTTSRQ